MRRVPREHIPMRKRLLRLSVPLALNDALRAGLNTAEQLLIPIGLARYGGSTKRWTARSAFWRSATVLTSAF